MRAALWLLALFGVAVAIALFAGNNQGTVTLFWPPYRVDLSLNLVLLLLFAAFVFLHAALGALAALFDLPRQALRWRSQQKERAMHAFLLESIAHMLAGRFIRARKAAEGALAQEKSLAAGAECAPWPTCWWPRALRPCRTSRRGTNTCSWRCSRLPSAMPRRCRKAP